MKSTRFTHSMQRQGLHLRALAFVAGVVLLASSGWASADPPSRVARLGYMSGAVSFSPAGESDWDQATLNRPLTTGDRLWTEAGARAEIQVGGAVIRMHADTGTSVLNLDDRITQLQLTQGALNVHVRHLEPDQVFEVDTPNLALILRQPGAYRIEVDPDGYATTIIMRRGQGDAYGEDASYVIDSRQVYRFKGTDLREYQVVDVPRLDEFDRWASDRDRRYDNSGSARYVSQDVVGYQDLDANGTWRDDPTWGNVWFPNRVSADWAPYRDGHWAWIDPWGWTWVDDAPWGFAVSHYGRWTHLHGTWGWVPGPVRSRAYYAPALVAFVGGDNFRLTISSGNVSGIAWFPLGPREVYRPSYPVSRGYFERVNRSNTLINNTVIHNHYNNTNVAHDRYANRHVRGAVVAVPVTVFEQSRPVHRAAVQVSRELQSGGPVAFVPPVAPTEKSVRGGASRGGKPPPHVFDRRAVAHTAPPAPHVGFAAQRPHLTAKPGKPLDAASRRQLQRGSAMPAPVVQVVAPRQGAPRTLRPPPEAPAARPGDARRSPDERKARTAPAVSSAPSAAMQGGAPAQARPPAANAQAPEQQGRSERRERREQREQPVAQPPTPPQRAAQPQFAPRPAMPTQPAAQPQESRGKSEQRGNREPRSATSPPPQRSTQPRVAPPPHIAAPPAQQPARRARPGPDARQAEPHPTVAAPEPTPKTESRGQRPKPAAEKPNDRKRDGDKRGREEENRR